MPSNSLGLNKLEPFKRARPMLYEDDEFEQIEVARKRGVGWNQIQQAVPRYKTVETLKYAFKAWKRRNAKKE